MLPEERLGKVADGNPGALVTMEALVAHYRKTELQVTNDEDGKAATTRDCYESYLKSWIVPQWGQKLVVERFIRPAATAAGINKKLGWHTFRHTYATLLKDNGEDVKVVQELLRHANARMTLDIYAQAITESKRLAQARVMAKLVPQELVQ